jgi:hypothetical protein
MMLPSGQNTFPDPTVLCSYLTIRASIATGQAYFVELAGKSRKYLQVLQNYLNF